MNIFYSYFFHITAVFAKKSFMNWGFIIKISIKMNPPADVE